VKYVNLTPHEIHLNDGRVFPPSGEVVRVSVTFTEVQGDTCQQIYGEVENLPPYQEGTRYIVSSMVMNALKEGHFDIVAPATGHPDCVRDAAGHIVSVPCFVSAI